MKKNIIIAVCAILVLFCAFWLGTCNKKKVVLTDTTTAKIVALQKDTARLNAKIDSILKVKAAKEKELVESQKNAENMQGQQVKYINQITQLTLTQSVILAQLKFKDTTKLQLIQYGGNTKVALSEKQLTEHNVSVSNESFLKSLNDTLKSQLSKCKGLDVTNNGLITEYKNEIADLKNMGTEKDGKIVTLESGLKAETKKYNWQRAEKYIVKGIAGVLLVFLAFKK